MIVRKDSTIFNGAHCEAGVKMSEEQAAEHLLENARTYLGFGTLTVRPGEVFFARLGACLFEKSPGCTVFMLTDGAAERPDAAQPGLASSQAKYVRPGQASFLPQFQLFCADSGGNPMTAANECIEGGLGSCWLLAAVASVAQHPGAIPGLVTKRRDGKYDVELYVANRWSTFTVDDALPACGHDGQLTPAYARPGAGEVPPIWPCLLEKAFAVAMGNSYANLNGGYARTALEMLTGARPTDVAPARLTPEELHAKVSGYLRTGHAILAASRMFDQTTYADLVFRDPIAQMHVYSLLGSREGEDGALELQLRNPWGRLGLLQPGAALQDQPDGTFWMPASAIAEYFDTINIAKVESASQ